MIVSHRELFGAILRITNSTELGTLSRPFQTMIRFTKRTAHRRINGILLVLVYHVPTEITIAGIGETVSSSQYPSGRKKPLRDKSQPFVKRDAQDY